jgi:DNA-binding XRE family transcriptional regulator
MHVLHTVLEIRHIEPFRITCLWNTGEVRVNDFTPYLRGKNARLHGLADAAAFEQVHIVDGTLQWPQVLVSGLHKGNLTEQPLTLDPEVLYIESQLIGTSLRTAMSFRLRQARLTAGLTQTQLAALSGTTKEYISRLESGKADFQVSTFDRILQQGLGKHAEVLIS